MVKINCVCFVQHSIHFTAFSSCSYKHTQCSSFILCLMFIYCVYMYYIYGLTLGKCGRPTCSATTLALSFIYTRLHVVIKFRILCVSDSDYDLNLIQVIKKCCLNGSAFSGYSHIPIQMRTLLSSSTSVRCDNIQFHVDFVLFL